MSYQVKTTSYNGYRCSCCERVWESEAWFDQKVEALSRLPREFPVETEYGGIISVVVKDGATGQEIGSSRVTWPFAYQRGDEYKYTCWTLYIPGDDDTDSVLLEQIISGRRLSGDDEDDPPALKLITDQSWDVICQAISLAAHAAKVKKAEAELAAAQKKLKSL